MLGSLFLFHSADFDCWISLSMLERQCNGNMYLCAIIIISRQSDCSNKQYLMQNPFTKQSSQSKGSTLLQRLISPNSQTTNNMIFQPHPAIATKQKQQKQEKEKEKQKENKKSSDKMNVDSQISKTQSLEYFDDHKQKGNNQNIADRKDNLQQEYFINDELMKKKKLSITVLQKSKKELYSFYTTITSLTNSQPQLNFSSFHLPQKTLQNLHQQWQTTATQNKLIQQSCLHISNTKIFTQISRNPLNPLPSNIVKRLEMSFGFYLFQKGRDQAVRKMLKQSREIGGNGRSDGSADRDLQRDAWLEFYWRVNGQSKNMEAFLVDDKVALIRSYKLLCQQGRLSTRKQLSKPQQQKILSYLPTLQPNPQLQHELLQLLHLLTITHKSQFIEQQLKQIFIPIIIKLQQQIESSNNEEIKKLFQKYILELWIVWNGKYMDAIHLGIGAKYYLLDCGQKFGNLRWLGDVMGGLVGWDMGSMGGRLEGRLEGKCRRLLGINDKQVSSEEEIFLCMEAMLLISQCKKAKFAKYQKPLIDILHKHCQVSLLTYPISLSSTYLSESLVLCSRYYRQQAAKNITLATLNSHLPQYYKFKETNENCVILTYLLCLLQQSIHHDSAANNVYANGSISVKIQDIQDCLEKFSYSSCISSGEHQVLNIVRLCCKYMNEIGVVGLKLVPQILQIIDHLHTYFTSNQPNHERLQSLKKQHVNIQALTLSLSTACLHNIQIYTNIYTQIIQKISKHGGGKQTIELVQNIYEHWSSKIINTKIHIKNIIYIRTISTLSAMFASNNNSNYADRADHGDWRQLFYDVFDGLDRRGVKFQGVMRWVLEDVDRGDSGEHGLGLLATLLALQDLNSDNIHSFRTKLLKFIIQKSDLIVKNCVNNLNNNKTNHNEISLKISKLLLSTLYLNPKKSSLPCLLSFPASSSTQSPSSITLKYKHKQQILLLQIGIKFDNKLLETIINQNNVYDITNSCLSLCKFKTKQLGFQFELEDVGWACRAYGVIIRLFLYGVVRVNGTVMEGLVVGLTNILVSKMVNIPADILMIMLTPLLSYLSQTPSQPSKCLLLELLTSLTPSAANPKSCDKQQPKCKNNVIKLSQILLILEMDNEHKDNEKLENRQKLDLKINQSTSSFPFSYSYSHLCSNIHVKYIQLFMIFINHSSFFCSSSLSEVSKFVDMCVGIVARVIQGIFGTNVRPGAISLSQNKKWIDVFALATLKLCQFIYTMRIMSASTYCIKPQITILSNMISSQQTLHQHPHFAQCLKLLGQSCKQQKDTNLNTQVNIKEYNESLIDLSLQNKQSLSTCFLGLTQRITKYLHHSSTNLYAKNKDKKSEGQRGLNDRDVHIGKRDDFEDQAKGEMLLYYFWYLLVQIGNEERSSISYLYDLPNTSHSQVSINRQIKQQMSELIDKILSQQSMSICQQAWSISIIHQLTRIHPNILTPPPLVPKLLNFVCALIQNLPKSSSNFCEKQYLEHWIIFIQSMELICYLFKNNFHCRAYTHPNANQIWPILDRLRIAIFSKIQGWADGTKRNQQEDLVEPVLGYKQGAITKQNYDKIKATITNLTIGKPKQKNDQAKNEQPINVKPVWQYLKYTMQLCTSYFILYICRVDIQSSLSCRSNLQQEKIQCCQQLLQNYSKFHDEHLNSQQSKQNLHESLKCLNNHQLMHLQKYLPKILLQYCEVNGMGSGRSGVRKFGIGVHSASMSRSSANVTGSIKISRLAGQESLDRGLSAVFWYNAIQDILLAMGVEVSYKFTNSKADRGISRIKNSRIISR